MPLNWTPPVCSICQKVKLIHRRQQDLDACYQCSRRKKVQVYCDHCSWTGRTTLLAACPGCRAYGRLHLIRCGVLGHWAGCPCQAGQDA